MKYFIQFLMIIGVLFFTQNLHAQDYKKFETNLSVKLILLQGNYSGSGLGFFLEPRINLNNRLAVGLRAGMDIMGGTLQENGDEISLGTSILHCYYLTGDYMLKTEGNIRPFVGLGMGLYTQGAIENRRPYRAIDLGTAFGVLPRVGIELGLFRLEIDYSFYFKKEAKKYLGINVGLNLGGRYKKEGG